MKILIIEDDPEIVEVVSLAIQIRWSDAQVISTHMGEKGIDLVDEEKPDAVILDLGLPDISGYDVLKRIRLFSDVCVIILTSRDDEVDIIKGLEWGADDYVSKPFRQLELVSRIQSILRRSRSAEKQGASRREPDFVAGDLLIEYETRTVRRGNEVIKLTPTEYQLLYHLTKNCGRLLTARTLLSKVWGKEYMDDREYLKVHISNLRRKLGDDAGGEGYIVNERGIGYRFLMPEA